MSEGIKKYIMISATILLVLFNLGICYICGFFKTSWLFVFIFSYLFGIANGMLILGILNLED